VVICELRKDDGQVRMKIIAVRNTRKHSDYVLYSQVVAYSGFYERATIRGSEGRKSLSGVQGRAAEAEELLQIYA
jgi:hypothetical protein